MYRICSHYGRMFPVLHTRICFTICQLASKEAMPVVLLLLLLFFCLSIVYDLRLMCIITDYNNTVKKKQVLSIQKSILTHYKSSCSHTVHLRIDHAWQKAQLSIVVALHGLRCLSHYSSAAYCFPHSIWK